MSNKFSRLSYGKRRPSQLLRNRSKRTHEFDFESAVRLRKKVFVILAYLGYLFFYSKYFRILYLNISRNSEVATEEVENFVWQALEQSRLGLFPGDNYFFVKTKRIQDKFDEQGLLVELEIKKKFPHTLNINLTDKLGQMIWISNEQFYILNLEGIIEKQLPIKDLVNVEVPVIYDSSNVLFDINQQLVNKQLVDLILESYQTFTSYELPVIDLDYFKVDSPDSNYIKIVTKQGFEIHVNYLTSFGSQINKLKQSLLVGKIDLNKVNYINLRVENQVIYK